MNRRLNERFKENVQTNTCKTQPRLTIRKVTDPYFRLFYAVVVVCGSRSRQESSSGPSRLKTDLNSTISRIFTNNMFMLYIKNYFISII